MLAQQIGVVPDDNPRARRCTRWRQVMAFVISGLLHASLVFASVWLAEIWRLEAPPTEHGRASIEMALSQASVARAESAEESETDLVAPQIEVALVIDSPEPTAALQAATEPVSRRVTDPRCAAPNCPRLSNCPQRPMWRCRGKPIV